MQMSPAAALRSETAPEERLRVQRRATLDRAAAGTDALERQQRSQGVEARRRRRHALASACETPHGGRQSCQQRSRLSPDGGFTEVGAEHPTQGA